MLPRRAVPAALPAALLAVLLGVAACSGGDGGDDSGGSTSSAAGDADAPALASEADGPVDGVGFQAGSTRSLSKQDMPVEIPRSVIRKGNVELRADDVGTAQFEVQKVADRYAGQVTEEETTTGDDGDPAYTRMVLRIPSESFDAAFDALQESAELVSASSGENDVTAKVIDTATRLKAQRRSIARITVLFDRAESIRDIMRIESELSRRQADLESLERQMTYLRGQTSMSTITVSIDQTPKAKVTKQDADDAGFLTGLSAGWDALTTFAVALLTAFGALLPWLVVLGLVGIPALLIWRRRRVTPPSDDPGRTPSAA